MAALNLLCLPYSGASGIMVYSRWRRALPSWLEVHPVELPGRGTRMGEPFHTDLHTLARQLAREQCLVANAPYALLGHSLGALVAFELAHELQALGWPAPTALIACGAAAPARREAYGRVMWCEPLSDAELIDELRRLEGTPDEVLASPELMSLVLPTLRADFLLCGRYVYSERKPLCCSIHVLAGENDYASDEQLLAWHKETTGDFFMHEFPGGHFFIHTHEHRVLDTVIMALEPHRPIG